jgi:hypothetical protein
MLHPALLMLKTYESSGITHSSRNITSVAGPNKCGDRTDKLLKYGGAKTGEADMLLHCRKPFEISSRSAPAMMFSLSPSA